MKQTQRLLDPKILRYAGFCALLMVGCAGGASRVGAAEPILSAADEAFFKDQAQRIVNSASLPAGQKSGEYHNTTPYDVHVPGGNMGYPAYWTRDSVMMLGADFISAKETEGWVRLICSTLRGKDWLVRPGVVVPAYAVPDHVNFNGKATFYPGNYETGDKQGGNPWGKYPPLDDDFFFITAVYEHWKMTGSTQLFTGPMKTSFGEEPLCDICEKVYKRALSDPATGLPMAGDIETENAKDWGFCDGESKSGKLLFTSVLKFTAANQLAEMFDSAKKPEKVKHYKDDAARLKAAIAPTFFHPSADGKEGWLHSATEIGNQPDVWGSAFAVYSGAVDGATANKVARALVRAFRDKTAVREGNVRQILTTDKSFGGGWQHSISEVGNYQNGGYWATPTGWYIAAIHTVDPQAAKDMAKDYIQFLRDHMRPDGTAEAWEWFNPDTGAKNNPLYGSTVALPYACLKKAGLLNVSAQKRP
jgi:hypothetical protein